MIDPTGPSGYDNRGFGLARAKASASSPGQLDDHRAYSVREERCRTAAKAARVREDREREDKRRRQGATAWPCPGPERGRKVHPAGPDDEWGAGAAPGGLCSVYEPFVTPSRVR
ncbi:hypothetical protein ACWCQL_14900 [Streptomyces sp. NPDC002073]